MLQITISKRAAFIALLAVLLVIPVAALATHVFDDVGDGSTHIDGITFMKDSGVSVGCDANNNFCPDDNVTRAQMGTFMYRMSGNDPSTDPSVNADTVDGYNALDLIPVITRLSYNSGVTDSSVDSVYEKVADIGTFTKNDPSTVILIDMTGHASVTGSFCHYQVRIDDLTDIGDTGSTLDGGSAVLYSTGNASVSAMFPGLAAGDHTVSVWLRGSATTCIWNNGNFHHTVLVTETQRTVGAGSVFASDNAGSDQGE